MAKVYPDLYTRDSSGNIRVWRMEQDGNAIRSVSGQEAGKFVESAWKTIYGKNGGKANETTDVEQAQKDIESSYRKQIKTGYFEDKNSIDDFVFYSPMLAKSFEEKKITFPCWVQPKLDGIRNIQHKGRSQSRGNSFFESVPHISAGLSHLEHLILDGELYNHLLHDDFNEISSLVRKTTSLTSEELEKTNEFVQYHIYDLYDTEKTFLERQEILKTLFLPDCCFIVPTEKINNLSELYAKYEEYLNNGYEGMMVRYDGAYEAGKRSKNLWKMKVLSTEEFKIIDIVSGKGNWEGYAKSVFCVDSEGREFSAGVKGSQEHTSKIFQDRNKYIPNGWVTVEFNGFTPRGVPRFGRVVDFYEGMRNV